MSNSGIECSLLAARASAKLSFSLCEVTIDVTLAYQIATKAAGFDRWLNHTGTVHEYRRKE